MTDLAVVVVNWNRAEATDRCLTGLAGWRRLAPTVWVVDNASAGGLPPTLKRRFPRVEWLESPVNLGFGGACNAALAKITSRYALLLNNDVEIGEREVSDLLAVLEAGPGLLGVAPLVVEAGEGGETVTAGGRDIARHPRTHLTLAELQADGDDGGPIGVRYLPGAAALLRVEAVRRLGLLAEDYFFGGEMADLCERAADLDLAVAVVPGCRARHDLDEAGAWRRRLYPYYILRNRFLFIRRHRRRRLAPLTLFWIAYGLAAAARALARGDAAAARALALGLVDGLTGRFGDGNRRVLGAAA